MRADGVDPRDVTWEDDSPVYRVYFWHRPEAPPDAPPGTMRYACHEYRLVDADDVHEALAWAEARRRDSDTYTLYVETDGKRRDEADRGLLRLFGTDPSAPTDSDKGDTVTVWLPDPDPDPDA